MGRKNKDTVMIVRSVIFWNVGKAVRDFIHVNLIAGFFVALPAAFTVVVLLWVWDKLDEPLANVFKITGALPVKGSSLDRILLAIKSDRYSELFLPLLGFCILFVLVILLGLIVRSFIGRYMLGAMEQFFVRVPLVGMLYSSVKQLAEAFIGDDGKSKFQSAVLVQFPMKGSWAIGFVTGSATGPLADTMSAPLREEAEGLGLPPPDIITVFVPTTPLPTQGFTLVLPRTETRTLPISVEEAIKLVISGGIIAKPGDSAAHPKMKAE